MSTLNEALIALNKGKGNGSYRIAQSGEKRHLCYVPELEEYFTISFGSSRRDLTEEDVNANDWVIE